MIQEQRYTNTTLGLTIKFFDSNILDNGKVEILYWDDSDTILSVIVDELIESDWVEL